MNIGGETTYTWSIVDQPTGTADALSSTSIQNPTFTPKKEGTYLLRLVVNQGLATEQKNTVIAAVRQLKTRERIIAAGETTEADVSRGWATANNKYLLRVDKLLGDPHVVVGVNTSGGLRTAGEIVRVTSLATIKSGLPGQETVPGFVLATATTLGQVDELLGIIERGVDGGNTVASNGLMQVKLLGIPRDNSGAPLNFGGAPAVGDIIYLSDAGVPSLTAGTVRRQIASVVAVGGGNYNIMFDGVGGADITPIDRAYVVLGSPGTLTNAIRVDGANATGITTPFRIKSGDDATVTLQLKRNSGTGSALLQFLSEADVLLLSVGVDGSIVTPGTLTIKGAGGLTVATLAVVGAGSQLTMPNGAASVTAVFGAGTTVAFVGATSNSPLDLIANGATKWRVLATGEFQAQGANRAIQSVLDPVGAQDAATKNYTDTGFAPTILSFGATGLQAAGGATSFMFPWWDTAVVGTAEYWIMIPGPAATTYKLSNLRIAANGLGIGANTVTFTLRNNAGDTALVASGRADATSWNDLTHTVTVTAGDLISLKVTVAAGGGYTAPQLGVMASVELTKS